MRARRRVAPSLALALAVTAMATSAMTAAMIWLEGGGGLWPGLVRYQGQLHHQLADALRALRAGNPIHAALVLGTLSLFYGVAHAVGPGHGKAVISSYLLADGATIRSGIGLEFAAALTQATSAVAVVLIGWFVLGLAGFQLTQVASYTETLSFALVAALGCGMAAAGAARLIEYCRRLPSRTVDAPEYGTTENLFRHDHRGDCGHHHAPLPLSEGPNRGWRTAGVVVAVGLRPCTGALIVLMFALVNGLLLAGIAATLAMALGTAITVSALAALSVQAKLLALRLFAASQDRLRLINGCLYLGGGIVVAALGIGLLLTPAASAPF